LGCPPGSLLGLVSFQGAEKTDGWGGSGRDYITLHMWGLPKMVGFPNNHGFFLLKMIILRCFGGTTISGNTRIDMPVAPG